MGEEIVFDRADIAIFTSANMATATLASASLPIYGMIGWAAQLFFTGSPVGTFKAQGSCNATGVPPTTDAEWSDIGDSSQAISAAGNILYNYDSANFNWVRIVYTKTSGTGTLNGRFNAKGN